MPATPTIEVPVTIDLAPAADALEDLANALAVTGTFLKSKAEDLRNAGTRERNRALGELLISEATNPDGTIDEAKVRELIEAGVTDTPERFETDAEARAAGADPDELGTTIGIEITD